MLYTASPSIAIAIADATVRNGGATFTTSGNQSGRPFWAVSCYPERGQIIHDTHISADDVSWYISQNADVWDADNAIGTWVHDGKTYLDVTRLVVDRNDALALAARYDQLAIYNLATGEEVSTASRDGVAA